MMTITTHWYDLGHGNKQNRDATIQDLCEAIKVIRTVSQDVYNFLPHEPHRLPKRDGGQLETYYKALEALNENVNMLNPTTTNNVSLRYTQIYALLKLISDTLVVKLPQLVRQHNTVNLDSAKSLAKASDSASDLQNEFMDCI